MQEDKQSNIGNAVPEKSSQGEQQPAAAEPVAQQIIVEKTNVGLGGWLIFFVICLGGAAFSYLMLFFASLASLVGSGNPSASTIISLLMSPIVSGLATVAIIFIAMRKKIGKWLAIGTHAAGFVFYVFVVVVSRIEICSRYSGYYLYSSSSCTASAWILIFGSIVGFGLIAGLMSLYYFMSKRVKSTLTEN